MEDNWISIKDEKPERKGKELLIWFYSSKDKSITLGYGNEYGYYDMNGTGVSFSKWQYLNPPSPPK